MVSEGSAETSFYASLVPTSILWTISFVEKLLLKGLSTKFYLTK